MCCEQWCTRGTGVWTVVQDAKPNGGAGKNGKNGAAAGAAADDADEADGQGCALPSALPGVVLSLLPWRSQDCTGRQH